MSTSLQQTINKLAKISIETASFSFREDFDTDLEYYQYSTKRDSYIDLLVSAGFANTRESAEDLQYLVLKEIKERVEREEV